jgi:hypothetical protein
MPKHYEVRTYVHCLIEEQDCTESKYGIALEFDCENCKSYQDWKKGNRKIRK